MAISNKLRGTKENMLMEAIRADKRDSRHLQAYSSNSTCSHARDAGQQEMTNVCRHSKADTALRMQMSFS